MIQVDQTVQDCLFVRISDNYVEFLRECAAIAVDVKCAETFLCRYPDAICQAVYCTFICRYPASWKRFNEEFRTDLCNTVYMWQVGKTTLFLLPNFIVTSETGVSCLFYKHCIFNSSCLENH